MPPDPFSPGSPAQWLRRAKSNFALAKQKQTPDVYLEDLCFETQQAAEKCFKSILIHLKIPFPFIHDLSALITLLESHGVGITEGVRQASRLTGYAVNARYPGIDEPVTEDEYHRALEIAGTVVAWAENYFASNQGEQ